MFWDKVVEIFTATPLWELGLIFLSRIIEVSIGTLRIILVNKGFRKQGVILSFFEILLWVLVASRVLAGINEEPLKAIVYCLGFAAGVYLGSILENKIALGKVLIQVITSEESGDLICESLRAQGYGVTSVKAKGKESDKNVLMIYANRKGKEEIVKICNAIDEKAMIITNDISNLKGGYINSIKRLGK